MLSLMLCASALTLDEAWEALQKNNQDLALVHEQTVQAQANRFQAFAAIQPQISVTGNYIINDHETSADFGSSLFGNLPDSIKPLFDGITIPPIVLEQKAYYTFELQVAQPLLNGQAVPGLRLVGQNLKANRAEEKNVRSQLHAGLAHAFYGVVVAREGLKLAEEAEENAKKHRSMVELQANVGVVAPNAKLQAELAVSRASREVAAARAGVTTAEQAFTGLTGLEPDATMVMPAPPTLPALDLDQCIEAARTHRPDLEAAAYRMNAAEANRLLSYASWLPTVNGVFRYNLNPETDFNPDGSRWKIIFNAQWTLWDGGMRIGANQVAASQFRQASESQVKAQQQAEQQIRVDWEQVQRADAALSAVEHEITLAQDNLHLAEVAFQAGTLAFLDLEDARLGWQATRMSQLSERMNRDLAVLDLRAAIGDY
jgi:outer membrane protein TolC